MRKEVSTKNLLNHIKLTRKKQTKTKIKRQWKNQKKGKAIGKKKS